ncbi:MAG: NUDIX domain-containing protein [bacterium]
MSAVKKRVQALIHNLSKDFSLDKLSKSPARFNTQKLDWFNRQYIQMLSLEEFALRSFKNRIQNTFKAKDERRYRVGDYVYFVDLKTSKIYANKDLSTSGQDGDFYPVGGGRGELSWQDNLQKEVDEETGKQVVLDFNRVYKITEFRVVSGVPFNSDNAEYDGKEFHIYFYSINQDELKPHTEKDFVDGQSEEWEYDWYDLEEVITSNQFLGLPLFREFCKSHGISLSLDSNLTRKAYLAWYLDKQRITVLSEFGIESSCILNWQKPLAEEIKWKKITLEESQENLEKIKIHIQSIFVQTEFIELQKDLFESILSPDLDAKFKSVTDYLENEIKSWLNQNEYQAGNFLWPLRVALSGKLKSPSPFEILAILDINEVNKRIETVLSNP